MKKADDDKFKSLNRGKYGEDETREDHPSFGQLQFVRTTGGQPNLYGSSIQHQNKIALEISHSQKNKKSEQDLVLSNTTNHSGRNVPHAVCRSHHNDGQQPDPCHHHQVAR